MQVGGEDDGRREDALLILTLRFAVELLEPLVHQGERRLVRNEDLGGLALVVEHIADRGVFVAIVLVQIGIGKLVLRVLSALHQRVDIGAGYRDRQKTDCGQNTVTAADVIRYDKGLVALAVGELL